MSGNGVQGGYVGQAKLAQSVLDDGYASGVVRFAGLGRVDSLDDFVSVRGYEGI